MNTIPKGAHQSPLLPSPPPPDVRYDIYTIVKEGVTEFCVHELNPKPLTLAFAIALFFFGFLSCFSLSSFSGNEPSSYPTGLSIYI